MRRRYILSYDLGTSGVKAGLYDETGRLIASRYGTYTTLYPADERREQRPAEWWSRVVQVTREIAEQFDAGGVAAVGVSGHSLGTIPVDRERNLLTDTTPIWSDARAIHEAEAFFEKTDYRRWYEATGNGFPPHLYSIFKQMWLKEYEPEIYERTDCFLGSKDYINFLLTGQKATDRSYASGSGVYDLKKGQYIDGYLECAGIDKRKLPRIAASDAVIGYVTGTAAAELGIPGGVPVVAGGVDNACMSLGANCRKSGDAYASLGSSAWITVCADSPSLNFETKTYTFAHCVKDKFIPSVGVFSSGSSLEWAISRLFAGLEKEKDRYERFSFLARSSPAGANGLFFIPNLAGGSSFDPRPDVRGMIANLDLKHTPADVARAVYEGIALHLRCAYDAFGSETASVKKLLLVGGGAQNEVWCGIYASVFGIPVFRTAMTQGAASLGAAALAAVGTGLWKDYEMLDTLQKEECVIDPDEADMKYYQKMRIRYKKLCLLTGQVAEILQE